MILGDDGSVFHWEQPLPDDTDFTFNSYRVGDRVRLIFEKRTKQDTTVWLYDWWLSDEQFKDLLEELVIWGLT